ncbi:MAG: hypothetical protein CFK52_05015 [Chloracidobacterium sp. CP2_5A]|nr:MAG: hypothetical protein CFK52_05015 [Chloracidobacterium sp. CP2_5A]
MITNDSDPLETELAASLRLPATLPDLSPVLRAARRRVAARSVLALALGRIWLALARLLAPAAARLHRIAVYILK